MEQYSQFIVKYWYLFALVGALIAALAWTFINDLRTGASRIGPAEATRLINREDALVFDLRDTTEFAKGHILNAMHAPQSTFETRLAELGKHRERPVILCCAQGASLKTVTAQLSRSGFTRIYTLKGGVQAWASDGLPLVIGNA